MPHTLNYTKDNVRHYWQGIYDLPTLTWPYKYPIKWMNNIIKRDKCQEYMKQYSNNNLVFIARRTHGKDKIKEFFKHMNKKLNKNKWIIWEHNHNPNTHIKYNEYYCKLSITKYVIQFENYISAGQTIGEAGVYGIPVFSHGTKYLESALMPRFLFLNNNNNDDTNLKDILYKIAFLENHPLYYQRLKQEIIQRSKSIFNHEYSIQNFIYDAKQILYHATKEKKFLAT